jgi:hypothetical protein
MLFCRALVGVRGALRWLLCNGNGRQAMTLGSPRCGTAMLQVVEQRPKMFYGTSRARQRFKGSSSSSSSSSKENEKNKACKGW